jgi:hypothetical protein
MRVKHMKHSNKTLAACNMNCLMQHKIETTKIIGTYCYKICVNHMEYRDKKRLQHTGKQMKYFEQTITTGL